MGNKWIQPYGIRDWSFAVKTIIWMYETNDNFQTVIPQFGSSSKDEVLDTKSYTLGLLRSYQDCHYKISNKTTFLQCLFGITAISPDNF